MFKSIKKISVIIATLLLSGVTHAELVPSVSAVILGDVALGQSAAQTLTITNLGSKPVENVTVSISGNGGEFDVTNCPLIILPNRTCVLVVMLTPVHYGNKRKKLAIDGMEMLDDGTYSDVSLGVDLVGSSNNPNKP
jgi:hypothetical protein